ncbi:MAG TPA: FadR/GntR family transcriptional regulator [Candidatus Cybelea sp.]|jgi:DNA-binding FadR family transcriptional regulator
MSSLAVTRRGLADQVIERVRALVADGTYRVGDRLPPEGELCELFGVGRSTIREAMRVLANRGLVDIRHGEGTFVVSRALHESLEERLERAELEDIYEARMLIERPLAELAAQRRDTRDIAAMRKALRNRTRAIRAGQVEAYTESDFAFHLAVARASKNAALIGVYESFVHVVQPMLGRLMTAEYMAAENDELHAQLCETIAQGDVTATRRLVSSHLRKSRKDFSRRLL